MAEGGRTKGAGESCVSVGTREGKKKKIEDMGKTEKDKSLQVPSGRFNKFKRREKMKREVL